MFIILVLGLILVLAGVVALLIAGIGALASLAPIIACAILVVILVRMIREKVGGREKKN